MTCGYVFADDSNDDEHYWAYCPRHQWTGEPATSKQVAFLRLNQHREEQGEA